MSQTFFEKKFEAEVTSKRSPGNPPIEENDRDSFFPTSPEQVRPEFCLCNEENAGLDFLDGSPNEEGMVDW